MVRAGLLRQRVVIERLAEPEVRDAFGTPIETWVELATRWAGVEPFQGREFFDAQQTQAAADHRIRLRYDTLTAQITAAMRIRQGARLFDVQSVLNPESRNQDLEIIARERV